MTISDVADALGISKTTVSRAISGKGRIGKETRDRVLAYIKEHDYRPSPIAKGLAQSKTYNIGWVIPGDSQAKDLPFFQKCMMGVSSKAIENDYDVLISLVFDDDNSGLEKIVSNHKVDGIVLGRTTVHDKRIKLMKEAGIPFVTVGSTNDKNVLQVDNDHLSACRELTNKLISKGIKNISYIGGNTTHIVNRTRYKGFETAHKDNAVTIDSRLIYVDCEQEKQIIKAVDGAMKNGTECIVCSDDRICSIVINKLRSDGISVPEDVKLASFYNSEMLVNNQPPITAICYDDVELGREACRLLLNRIEGISVENDRIGPGYKIEYKESTL